MEILSRSNFVNPRPFPPDLFFFVEIYFVVMDERKKSLSTLFIKALGRLADGAGWDGGGWLIERIFC